MAKKWTEDGLIENGFDVVVASPAPETWKVLMKNSFELFTNWAKSTEMALYACVPQIAIKYGISLILWGENPGLQLGDLRTLGSTGYDGNNLRNMNTLAGGSIEWMTKDAGISEKILQPYFYPTTEDFEKNNLKIVYLGWFLGDWSNINNGLYSCANGLEVRTDSPKNTGDLYGVTALDEEWVSLNQMIKYYKYGFGRASDYVNEEIRHGNITREEGMSLINEYDGRCADIYIGSFCEYIGIDVSQFWTKVHNSMNKRLFYLRDDVRIEKKFIVGIGL